MSASAGLTYSGERFYRYFSDFHEKYGINDIYSGGFYPYDTLEEYWAGGRLDSHICSAALDTIISTVSLHTPVSPFILFTPQPLGQRLHLSNNCFILIFPN